MKNTHCLKLKRLGIDTYQEPVVYLHAHAPLCRSEGFRAQTRIQVQNSKTRIVATLNIVHDSKLILQNEAGLSEAAWKLLKAKKNEKATFSHPPPLESLSSVRSKIYGKNLSRENFKQIICDVSEGLYSDIELSTFITACAAKTLTPKETVFLTQAMIESGKQIHWNSPLVLDKHCIGGLPGNRTTPIIVSILSSLGFLIPKTSSRAITSPAGTADTMSVFTNVDLSLEELKQVVSKENACLAWGGAIDLSPADDILIRIERAINLDSEAQMVASILSKKVAAGATHALIDIPIGKTAKVRTLASAQKLKKLLEYCGKHIGLKVEVYFSSGKEPVGRGVGPALEAFDVLAVLENRNDAPQDLLEKSLLLSAKLIHLATHQKLKDSYALARESLESKAALKKFISICKAQGRFSKPKKAGFHSTLLSSNSGEIKAIDNRKLANLAKLAGAPEARQAGVNLHVSLKSKVKPSMPLLTVYAQTQGELDYALHYIQTQNHLFKIV